MRGRPLHTQATSPLVQCGVLGNLWSWPGSPRCPHWPPQGREGQAEQAPPRGARATAPSGLTHHHHAGDSVQQERGVDPAEEAQQEPLALAGRRQVRGADAAAHVRPRGLREAAPPGGPEADRPAPPAPRTVGTLRGAASLASAFYLEKISLKPAPSQNQSLPDV